MAFNYNEEEDLHSIDKKVIFDPKTHTYYYQSKPLISVTQFISTFHKEFDPLFSSINKAKRNTEEKKGIKDPHKLRKFWRLKGEYSSSIGTATHVFAEMYILDNTIKPKTGYEKAVIKALKYLKEKGFEIIAQELIVYSTEYMIAGSIDLLLYHSKTQTYWVGDWKTTEDLDKGYGKLYTPFSIKNNALNRYSIQLDIYSLLAPYRIPEKNRMIIKLNNDGTFKIYSPNKKEKKYKLPYTMDKTKLALNNYKKLNVKK